MLLLRLSCKRQCDFLLDCCFFFLLDSLPWGKPYCEQSHGDALVVRNEPPANNHVRGLGMDPPAPNKSSKIVTLANNLTAVSLKLELLS